MFTCELVEKTSTKNGRTYICLEITFPSGYKKLVFLTAPEQHLAMVSK